MRGMLWLLLAFAPAVAAADGEEAAARLAECAQLEELCEQACLNLDAFAPDEEPTSCYVECGARAETCRAAAQ